MSAAPFTREPFVLASAHAADGRTLPIRGEALIPEAVAGTDATVVVCHGFKGFARFGFFPHLAETLAGAGLRVVTFNFSGSGVGPDGETFSDEAAFYHNTFTRELADLAQVVGEAGRRGWLDEHYGLLGHSRGGGMAVLHAARDPHVAALVTWAAIATVDRWSAQDKAAWRARGHADVLNTRTGQVLKLGTATLDEIERLAGGALDVAGAAGRVRAPWLIVHGTADETVGVEDARRLAAAAPREHVRLELIEGAGHTFDVRHPMSAPPPALERAVQLTTAFLLEHLGPGA